jgi:hypothetical protein
VADVFISYSRRDAEFVHRLQDELESRGKEVWVDVEGIRDAEVFPYALQRAIESSDASYLSSVPTRCVRGSVCRRSITRSR